MLEPQTTAGKEVLSGSSRKQRCINYLGFTCSFASISVGGIANPIVIQILSEYNFSIHWIAIDYNGNWSGGFPPCGSTLLFREEDPMGYSHIASNL